MMVARSTNLIIFTTPECPLQPLSSYRDILNHAAVPQQGIQRRPAAPKGAEGIGSRPRSPNGENLIKEAATSGRIQRVACAVGSSFCRLFERSVGVRREHLGPLIAVVSSTVPTRKQMREIMREAVP